MTITMALRNFTAQLWHTTHGETLGRAGLAVAAALFLGLLAAAPALAETAFDGCQDEFWQSQPPSLTAKGVLYALCANHFATLYSTVTETPLYSAEHLTAAQITDAIHQHRANHFHPDARLPAEVAATLDDWRNSGWDRGHLAPVGDEPDPNSQYQSFVLSNMVPQNSDDNRHLWADIEMAVRELTLVSGDEVYVVSGPICSTDGPAPLHGHVWVPVLLYKAIYDPQSAIAGVYVVRNAAGHAYWRMSLADFAKRSGITPIPNVPADIAAKLGDLPTPAGDRRKYSR